MCYVYVLILFQNPELLHINEPKKSTVTLTQNRFVNRHSKLCALKGFIWNFSFFGPSTSYTGKNKTSQAVILQCMNFVV
jgi:hypothetical protein